MIEYSAKRWYVTFSDGTLCREFAIEDGHVLAMDPVSGCYTRCHSLTERQKRLILEDARSMDGSNQRAKRA